MINSMIAISRVAEEKMGGTSGALYSWVSKRRSSRLQLKILSQDLFLLARTSTGTFLWHSSDDRGLEQCAHVCACPAVHLHACTTTLAHARRSTHCFRGCASRWV